MRISDWSSDVCSSDLTLGGLATIKRGTTASVISKYNIQPVVDIYASTQGRDLGAVAGDVQNAVAALKKDLQKGSTVTVRGEYQTMNTAFNGLAFGLIGANVLIYLNIDGNFNTWMNPPYITGPLMGPRAP